MADLFARAVEALEQGHGAEASSLLVRALRAPGLRADEQIRLRCALAEAWLLQDDLRQATEALGRPPDGRERADPARLSDLWRLHGRLAAARGEPSRGIAFLTKALRFAERGHDSRAIGLSHYELALCYRQVGDTAIVREHLTAAASALHAAGDRRYLAMVHSLSGVVLAQDGRLDEALVAMRHAERLALAAGAGDVLATVCGNQANVALMQHRHDEALALADRSVTLQEESGTPHGLGVALASLGQILVRVGNLDRAEEILNRALDVRSPRQFMRETTGAVHDTLAQIHLIRGDHAEASRAVARAREAYGEYGAQTSQWYEWSLRVLDARLALRRGDPAAALDLAGDLVAAPGVPPAYAIQAELIAIEAHLAAGHPEEAQTRLQAAEGGIQPSAMSGTWGEFLRLRGRLHAIFERAGDAYHDFSQSVSVFELLGERYQAGLSYHEAGRVAAAAGAHDRASRYLTEAAARFTALGASPELAETRALLERVPSAPPAGLTALEVDGDDVLVRRLVDAASIPALLAREGAAALFDACGADAAVLFVRSPDGGIRILAGAGHGVGDTASLAAAAAQAVPRGQSGDALDAIGKDGGGVRYAWLSRRSRVPVDALRRFRMLCAVLRQGFDLCAARERPVQAASVAIERTLEPLLPGFVCAGAAMQRVADQIQRLQGNDLTVLITGESGTGKDLVARAIHAGSPRRDHMFLPYNCTSATRELADSQLFGHRRGSFTGALADQPGVLRTAVGGTLFLDEVGDLPIDVQPKLLRFLEQGEVLPVGETRPITVDVRVVAATNADLEQRVSEGRFREDLFYRLSVIRIHVPPLRQRREEISHLCSFFLREACERLGKPGVRLSAETLDLFDVFPWPGNVRQLRNEVQRAVALSAPEGLIEPEMLSPALAGTADAPTRTRARRTSLAAAIESLEREMIAAALEQAGGNISETARSLGLTRRGLYLKMQRLGVGDL
jgi:hydrogenase-4 transcriptional activator